MTDAMLSKAQAAAAETGLANVEMRRGDALDLPMEKVARKYRVAGVNVHAAKRP